MSEPKILVIGEAFIDKYYVGTATRLSPEAPIPVVAVKEVIQFDGGAANVYENVKTLGATARLYTQGPRPIKNRLIANGHQLTRWDENDTIEPLDLLTKKDLMGHDGIIISDYGKGGFTPKVISLIVGTPLSCPIFIDTKNPGPWPHYGTFFFPNMKEWLASKDVYDLCANVIRTESENGMTQLQFGEAIWHDRAFAQRIVSVCGAGDTAIAAFAYQYCKNQSVSTALRFASKACAVVCAKPYTAVASHEEINAISG